MKIPKSVLSIIFFVSVFSCKTKTVPSKKQVALETIKPNILIIHVHDLGFHDFSLNGSQIYQAPIIDALAKQSVVFSNAYTNYPRCVSSRYAMIIGNYPIQNGDVPDAGFKITDVPDNKNFVKNIKATRYQTAYFGKWSLGEKQCRKNFGFAAGHAGSPISFLYPFNIVKRGNGKPKKSPIPDVDEVREKDDYLMDVMTDNGAKYITNVDKSKPFMAMFSIKKTPVRDF